MNNNNKLFASDKMRALRYRMVQERLYRTGIDENNRFNYYYGRSWTGELEYAAVDMHTNLIYVFDTNDGNWYPLYRGKEHIDNDLMSGLNYIDSLSCNDWYIYNLTNRLMCYLPSYSGHVFFGYPVYDIKYDPNEVRAYDPPVTSNDPLFDETGIGFSTRDKVSGEIGLRIHSKLRDQIKKAILLALLYTNHLVENAEISGSRIDRKCEILDKQLRISDNTDYILSEIDKYNKIQEKSRSMISDYKFLQKLLKTDSLNLFKDAMTPEEEAVFYV